MHSFSVLQGKYSKLNMSFVSDFPNFEKEMILKTFEFTINDRIPPKTKANQVLSPYSLSIGNADAMESVEQFVKFSSWNEKKFLNETRLVFEKKKDEMPKVIEDLRTPWTDESDEKVTNDYKEMINSYKNDKIPLRYLPFVYYYSWGFSKYYKFDGGEDLPKLLDDILSKIKTATSHLDVDQYSFYGSPADTEADEGLKKIYECIKIKNDELDKERLNESISDPSKLLTLQEIEKIKSKAIDDRCFISKFGADSLSERLGTSDNKEIELIRGLFKDVYGFANIKDFFEADKSDLEKFESQLKLLSENSPSKTKRKLFEWFLEDVVTYVEGL
jgi:hypothetical protein